ncbi:MAG: peptidylprolyl isomerase [Planktomarina sp.]
MRIKQLVFSTVLGVFAFGSFATAQDVSTQTVVARVGDTKITMAHLLAVKSRLPEQYQTLPDDVLFSGILDQLVQQSVLVQAVEAEPTWLSIALENEKRDLLSNYAVEQITQESVTDEAIAAAYSAQYESGAGEMEYNASHILVPTEDEAKALVTALEGGADFAELAAEKSTGPSGPNGGQLGWFGKGRMVPEFENAVVSMDVGAISAPVQTQFGWHVIKLNDSRSMMPPPLDTVRASIVETLQTQAISARIAELESRFTIERMTDGIDPSVMSTLSLDGQK